MAYMRFNTVTGEEEWATTYYCPICHEEVEDTLYVNDWNEIIGCPSCIHARDVEDAFNRS